MTRITNLILLVVGLVAGAIAVAAGGEAFASLSASANLDALVIATVAGAVGCLTLGAFGRGLVSRSR